MQITFKATGWCSAVGNFAQGTKADVSDALAAHLVDEVGCAERAAVPVAQAESSGNSGQVAQPAARRTRKKADAPAPEFPPADPDAKGGENNPLTMADAEADLAGAPRPE